MTICKQCGTAFKHKPSKKRKFCGMTCFYASRSVKDTTVCKQCGGEFKYRASKTQQFCTTKCSRKHSKTNGHNPATLNLISSTIRKKIKAGKMKTNVSRKFKHKGIVLDSGWELALAKRLDNIGVYWVRGTQIPWIDSTGTQRTYFPDFYLPEYDVYLEPKAPWTLKRKRTGREQEKVEYIKRHHPNVTFLWNKKHCETFTIAGDNR